VPRGKAKPKPVSVYVPPNVVADFNALVAEARAQFPTMSESGFIVALIVQETEKKRIKKKR
jgi:hypothetical protein